MWHGFLQSFNLNSIWYHEIADCLLLQNLYLLIIHDHFSFNATMYECRSRNSIVKWAKIQSVVSLFGPLAEMCVAWLRRCSEVGVGGGGLAIGLLRRRRITCKEVFRYIQDFFYPKDRAAVSSKILVVMYQTIRRYVPQHCNLDTSCSENI
jgi:hypothetical protein